MSFFENTRKPAGLGGQLMVTMMNIGHGSIARWGASISGSSAGRKSAGLRLRRRGNHPNAAEKVRKRERKRHRLFTCQRGKSKKAQSGRHRGGTLYGPARQRDGYGLRE